MAGTYHLIISIEHSVPIDGGWDDVVQQYQARIVQNPHERGTLAGTFRFYVINMGLAAERGTDLVDVADSIDQDVYDYCATVFEPGTANLRAEVAEQFNFPLGSRLLILHLAKVLPAHRGQHLGLVAAERIIEQFGDGLVVAKPQPLQHIESYSNEKKMRYESFETKPKAAMKRLEGHWQRLGFERIGETEYLALSTDTKRKKPKPKLRPTKKSRRG